jgi:GNAT superfamily N-acetyltransferase
MITAIRACKDNLAAFCSLPGLSELAPQLVERQHPDSSWIIMEREVVIARFSLWWKQVPYYPGERLGLIGHYAVRDRRAAHEALRLACHELSATGCTMAVAPMDGNTWNRYRLLTERGTEPTFFLEPDNPDDWPSDFETSGFESMAQYYSAMNRDLSRCVSARDLDDRFAAEGFRIRVFDSADWENELARVWQVASQAFRENFLYTPIEEEEFLAIYRPLLPLVRHELILIAERAGEPVGFSFNVPDLLQAKRGLAIDTLIVKSLAVIPQWVGRGLGTLLVSRSLQAARALGFRRGIMALMHEANASRHIARTLMKDFRRYTLYGRIL